MACPRFAPQSRLFGCLLCLLLWPGLVVAQDDGDEDAGQAEEAPEAAEEDAEAEGDDEAGENADAGAADNEPRFRSRAERDRQLLADRFPEEAEWLALPEPEDEALALFRPADSEPRGALVLLTSADRPPHWPPPLANLRRALPRHGWATFALTLPVPDDEPTPTENDAQAPEDREQEPDPEEGDGNAENGDGEDDPQEDRPTRQERIANRIEAALDWLNRNGEGNRILLLDALSAPAVMAELAEPLAAGVRGNAGENEDSPVEGPVRALILINRASGVRLDTEALETLFAVPELPVLDVFFGPSAQLRDRQRRHRDMARRQRLDRYQSLSIGRPTVRDADNERSFWVRRIHGFMQRQAEGREVRFDTE